MPIIHRLRRLPFGMMERPMTTRVAASAAAGAEGCEYPSQVPRIGTNGRGRPIASAIPLTTASMDTKTIKAPNTCRQRLKMISTTIVARRNGRKNHAEPRAWSPFITVVPGSPRKSANHVLIVRSRTSHQLRVSGYANNVSHRTPVPMPIPSQNLPPARNSRGKGAREPAGRLRRPENLIPARRTSRRSHTHPLELSRYGSGLDG